MRISSFGLPHLSGLIIFLSLIAFLVNFCLYQFPGNNFFPSNMLLLTTSVVLMNAGLILLFGARSRLSACGLEFAYFFGIMSVVALATNAIQLTPFSPVDQHILSLEYYFHINIPEILTWTHQHPHFKTGLGIIYDSLPYQMSALPLIMIATGKFYLLREYYFLLLCTTLLGFTLYYFFPTTAPASVLFSPFFSSFQIATGLKFTQIHQHIIPTTSEGGLISFPSFHTIWALLGVYLLKEWRSACIFLSIINFFLIAACLLLGWHYFTDILVAITLTIISFYLLKLCKKNYPLISTSYYLRG